MIELSFTNTASDTRPFQCDGCPERIQKIRRCGRRGGPDRERWDFTENDEPIFPIRINKAGHPYPFCPAKATWDHEAVETYRLMVMVAQSHTMYVAGGIADQPAWFVELAAWFLPLYDNVRFNQRSHSILGDGKKKNTNKS